jgi:hypothetical protein
MTPRRQGAIAARESRTQGALIAALFTRLRTCYRAGQRGSPAVASSSSRLGGRERGIVMGWRAGSKTEAGETEVAEAADALTESAAEGTKGSKGKKSIYLILGGLVVGGAVAIWRWVRSLPKE